MNKEERMKIGNTIRYELSKGTHTFTMCSCGRHGCRSEKCWECWLEDLEYQGSSPKNRIPSVFIERAALCSVEGIRAICGTDKEYSEYVKKFGLSKNKKVRANK